MTEEFEWKDPPKPRLQLDWLKDVKTKLRRRPGQWAKVKEFDIGTDAYTAGATIRDGTNWEATVKKEGKAQWNLYMRYVKD